jgi:hypothetical protein
MKEVRCTGSLYCFKRVQRPWVWLLLASTVTGQAGVSLLPNEQSSLFILPQRAEGTPDGRSGGPLHAYNLKVGRPPSSLKGYIAGKTYYRLAHSLSLEFY